MPLAVPVLTSSKISSYIQHRTRPCNQRRSGAPTAVAALATQSLGHPPRSDIAIAKSNIERMVRRSDTVLSLQIHRPETAVRPVCPRILSNGIVTVDDLHRTFTRSFSGTASV